MRNLLKKIACLVMTLIMCVTFFSGCNLVTTDNKRDMNQVVATIKISNDIPKAENIYKKDIVMDYINYGYYYEYYQGMSRSEVMKSIINQLINNRVYVQNAMLAFDKGEAPFDIEKNTGKDKWDITRYLTEEEITDALYSTYKDMNNLLDNYAEEKADKVQDTMIEAVRTAPTDAKNAEKELSIDEKKAYIEKGVDVSGDRRKAFNEVIDLLESNELLGDDYNGALTSTLYYNETLKGYQEQALIEKFEKCVKDDARAKITYQDLKNVYLENYNKQAELDDTAFAEKLSSATASDPVLVCSATGNYGYVYNLLLGADEKQTAEIGKIDKTNSTDAEINEEISKVLASTVVKDLRSTWIWSGYDFDGAKFTGDYTFAKDAKNSLPFQGKVTLLTEDDGTDEYKPEYRIDDLYEYSLSQFIDIMEDYLYGAKQANANAGTDKAIYKKVNFNGNVEEYDAKINELLFAFSTDPGSLNTYKGYEISPVPDAGKDEKWTVNFANAGRELLGFTGTEYGKNSYIMVATDFGYHIMFYSEVFNKTYDYADLDAYLNAFYTKSANTWEEEFNAMINGWDDWEDTDSFIYTLFNSISSTPVNNALTSVQNKLLNDYVYSNNGSVVKYVDRYSDLLGA